MMQIEIVSIDHMIGDPLPDYMELAFDGFPDGSAKDHLVDLLRRGTERDRDSSAFLSRADSFEVQIQKFREDGKEDGDEVRLFHIRYREEENHEST